jgi:hypothetical protein
MIALPVVIHAQSHFAYQEKNKNFFLSKMKTAQHILLVGAEEMGIIPATQ